MPYSQLPNVVYTLITAPIEIIENEKPIKSQKSTKFESTKQRMFTSIQRVCRPEMNRAYEGTFQKNTCLVLSSFLNIIFSQKS